MEERRRVGLVAALLMALVLVIHAPTLSYDYVQDGVILFKANRVAERGDLVEIFTSDYWSGTPSAARTLYRPVAIATVAAERRLGGGAPWPAMSHGLAIALHAGNALLLLALARRWGASVPAAGAAAGLYAMHPLAAQTVVNLAGRSDLLATGFALAAAWLATWGGAWAGAAGCPPAWRRPAASWGAAALFFLALGSKEVAVAAGPLIVLQEILLRPGRRDRRWWLERLVFLAPLLAAVLLWLQLRTLALGVFPGLQQVPVEDNVLAGLSGWPYFATALGMAGRYAGLLLWPATLSADYSGAAIGVQRGVGGWAGLGLAALLITLASAVAPLRLSGPCARRVALAAAWLGLSYVVVGNLIVPNAAGFAVRLLYFPAVGACLLAGEALDALATRIPGRRRAVVLGLLLVPGLALAVQGRRVTADWSSPSRLFHAGLEAAPGSLRAQLFVARELRAAGDLAGSLARLEDAVERMPDLAPVRVEHGITLARLGRPAEALRTLAHAVAADPFDAQAHLYLGFAHMVLGHDGAAERSLTRALLHDPRLLQAAEALGDLSYRRGDFVRAADLYARCVERGRDSCRPRLQTARARLTDAGRN